MGEQVFNINFVRTVRRYPCVYDHGRLDYCLRHVTEAAWADIAKEVGEDVKTCKEKWKNLRTVFRRNLLKDGGASKRPYYLNEHMQFMIPLLHGAKRRGRGWYQQAQPDEEYDRELSWEDWEPDEEDERCMQEEEDPLQMVETVIKKEPSPLRTVKEPSPVISKEPSPLRVKKEDRQSEERPSTTQVKAEPEGKGQARRRQDEGQRWLSCKPVLSLVAREDVAEEEEEVPLKRARSASPEPDTRPLDLSEPRKQLAHCLDSPDTQFLLSLKPDLEQMTPRQKRKFKKEIFNLLDKILDDQGNEQSLSALNMPSSTSRHDRKK